MVVKNSMSWNTMIDGYMRNGGVDEGIDLLDRMPVRGKVSWTALISRFVKRYCFKEALGFAINGHTEEALEHFSTMQKEGFSPNGISFTGHAEEALEHFSTMQKEGFSPNGISFTGHAEEALEHFSPMRTFMFKLCLSM
ncbi:hypothetical protein GIB67_020561 [Kingdonia uniflora]|uniref:Pentatricopeptide repeat-containing protein n=1 Tax=Kingdonia uniflora TaxID=39325 RepID=A0A7J7NL70_9MAGN|nr:hypothetical protein GIB67_020561 [Kingdonia uniflora]